MNNALMNAGSVEAELAAIQQVVATVQHAQVNELPEVFIDLFREDAIWTTGHGKVLLGRDAIAEFTRAVLPGSFSGTGNTATYEVSHVFFVRPDVAAVKVRQRYLDAAGEQVGDEGSPLYVMAKEDGRWLLTANQNTPVVGE
ncbi:SgcJ/EcaC family oxidoreductase [Kitasatospora sp. NPDC089913]|uniref:SgcJ/EcaC family oxidoreductase n=1 Tax=Streptomycetaceae TaxID=2062 RepID=UPI001E487526|nr:SgcJ/EcaC family oxidoreductase [Streptomyces sp. TLI_053]